MLVLCACSQEADPPAASAGSAATAEATPAPVRDSWFEFDTNTHDFGDVYASAKRETTFALVAAGTEDLIVGEVQRSCGCTEGQLFVLAEGGARSPFEPGKAYAPGTRFELDASLNTRGRQGEQLQRVHLRIEGRPEPQSFELHAFIVTFLEFDPFEIVGATTLEGARGEFVVKSRGGEHFVLDALREVLPEELDLVFTPIEPDAGGRSDRWTLAFTIAPGVPKGPYKSKVILKTDVVNTEAEPLPDGSELVHMGELWVRTEFLGVFDIRPERLSFGRLAPGQGVTKKVVVRSRDAAFDMQDVEVAVFEKNGQGFHAHQDAFQVKAEPIDPGKAWEVEIKVADFPVAGNFDGILGIRTNHRFEPEIAIQFIGTAPETAAN